MAHAFGAINMPTRNVVLSNHQQELVEILVQSGFTAADDPVKALTSAVMPGSNGQPVTPNPDGHGAAKG